MSTQRSLLTKTVKTKKYATGAKRSAEGLSEQIRLDLLDLTALKRIGATLHEGMIKYGANNWQKGMPIDETLNHALIHIYQYLDGDISEDHLGHAFCNLMFACHFDSKEKATRDQLR